MTSFRNSRDWYGEKDCGAFAFVTFEPNFATMQLYQLLADMQPQAQTFPAHFHSVWRLIEAIKNLRQAGCANPTSCVGHGNADTSVVFIEGTADGNLSR